MGCERKISTPYARAPKGRVVLYIVWQPGHDVMPRNLSGYVGQRRRIQERKCFGLQLNIYGIVGLFIGAKLSRL